ncbi:hypothetical protein LEP1GSC190_08775 [Leptospira mayottensis 200901116]|nr:hypothetical protein LEP1GSC190_08775 [Leptospira mayottensis 200901116]
MSISHLYFYTFSVQPVLRPALSDDHGSFHAEITQAENGLIVSFRIATKKDREKFLNLVITSLKQKGIHCIFEEI